MIMCPNLQNPEVAKEFNELKEATSEKAAYHIWSANKGNNIDKAPNGAESILFNQILKLTNNDRAEAIRVKSKIYRRDFINWFGDWTDEDALSSKAVDLNGEPIMVWHGTDKLFDTFEVDSNNERGRHLFHDKNSFFFTDRQDKALKYKGAYTIPVYLNMRTVGKSDMTSGKFKTTNEYIDHENSLIKNDKYDSAIFVRYDKEGDNNGFEPTTQFVVKKENQIRSIVSNDFSSTSGNIYSNKKVVQAKQNVQEQTFQSEESNSNVIQEFLDKYAIQSKLAKASFDTSFGDISSILNRGEVVTSDILINGALNNKIVPINYTAMANVLKRHKVPVRAMPMDENVLAKAVTDSDGNTVIQINSNIVNKVSNEYLVKTLLHEVSHAVTVGMINNPKTDSQIKLKQANSKLYNIFNTLLDSDMYSREDGSGLYYGLTNEKEFIAEFMVNKEFRDELFKHAYYLDKKNNSKTLLGNIKNFINYISNALVGKSVFKGETQKELNDYKAQLSAYLLNIKTIENTHLSDAQIYKIIYKQTDPILYSNEQVLEMNRELTRLLKSFESNNYIEVDLLQSTSGQKDTQEQAQEKLDKLAVKISTGLSQRLKAVMSSTMPADQKSMIQKQLNLQISQFEEGHKHMYRSLITALSQILPQLLEESIELSKLSLNNEAMDVTKLQYQMHDNFGLYKHILHSIQKTLQSEQVIDILQQQQKESSFSKDAVFGDINNLINMVKKCEAVCDETMASIENILINTTRDILVEVGNETHSITMGDYLNSLSSIGFDSGVFYRYAGMTDKVKDEGLRSIVYLVNKALNKAEKLSFNKNVELIGAYKKLKFGESHLDIYEKDEHGRTTQYIIRDLNYGRFHNDYKKFLKSLNLKISKKYGIILEPFNSVAPEDDEQAKVEWNNAINDWLDKHCERPFKRSFYVAYSKLSQDTKYEWGLLTKQIRQLKEKCLGEDGYYHYEQLDEKDRALLTELNIQKRMLLSDHDYQGNPKQGDELRKAKELQQLQEDLYGSSEKSNIKRDVKAWNAARNNIIEKAGGIDEYNKYMRGEPNNFDNKMLENWDEMNSKRVLKQDKDGNVILFKRINEEAGEIIYEVDGDGGQAYEEVTNQINKILNVFRDFTTGDIAYQTIPVGEKLRLRKLLAEQTRLKNIAKRQNKAIRKQANLKRALYSKYTMTIPTEYYKKAAKQAAIDDIDNPGAYEAFIESTNEYYYDYLTQSEETRIIRYFTKLVARPEYEDEFMDFIPGDGWIEHQETYMANPNYDNNNKQFLQPKRFYEDENGNPIKSKPLYDNTAKFNKVMNSPTLRNLYNVVLETSREINQMYNRDNFDEYLLPGITGSVFKYQKNKTSLSNGILQYVKDKFGIGDQSVQQDQDFQQNINRILGITDDFGNIVEQKGVNISDGTRPDGSELNMIPRYYVNKLDDPSQLSSDLIGIMAEAYKSAADYKYKSEVRDQCETIADMMRFRDVYKKKTFKPWQLKRISGNDSNTYAIAKKFMLMHMYNVKSNDVTIGNVHLNVLGKLFKGLVTTLNLGVNITVAAIGLLSAFIAHIVNAIVGYKYSTTDATKAAGEVTWRLIKNYLGANYVSNTYSNDKLMLTCEFFNVSDQNDKKTNNVNRNRVVNVFTDNLVFGMLSGSDFLVKSNITVSTLLSYKYYNGNFITKQDLDINMRNASKEERKKAFKEWSKGVSAYSILSAKNHTLLVDEQYKDAFYRAENVMRSRIIKYAESADGMQTATQKAQLNTSFLGSLLLIHRQYFPLMLQERFGEIVYDLDTQQISGGIYRAFGAGMWYFTNAAYKFLYGSVKHLSIKNGFMQSKEYYNSRFGDTTTVRGYMTKKYINACTKQVIAEIAAINFIGFLASYFYNVMSKEVNKDKRRLLAMLTYILHRLTWETKTPYNFTDAFNNVKSPTAATSLTDKAGNLFESFSRKYIPTSSSLFDTFQSNTDKKEYNGNVKRGLYKGWDKVDRDLFKLLPVHNAYEQIYDSESKDRYFKNQIMKEGD